MSYNFQFPDVSAQKDAIVNGLMVTLGGVMMGEHDLVRWLDPFTALDKLHQKWLGRGMDAMQPL